MGKQSLPRWYTREDTKAAKGVAALLMVMHHLWYFPTRLPGGALQSVVMVFGQSLPSLVGAFGKICVSMFFFLGGYGLLLSSSSPGFNLIAKIKKLYMAYWSYAIPFVIVGFAFFAHQAPYCEQTSLCDRFSVPSVQQFMETMLGKTCVYNFEWWFFRDYLIALLTYPFLRRAFAGRRAATAVGLVVLASMLVSNVFPVLGKEEALGSLMDNQLYSDLVCQSAPWVACFWMGAVCAEHDLLGWLKRSVDGAGMGGPLVSVVGVGLAIFVRQLWLGASFDIFLVPVFLLCVYSIFESFGTLRRVFVWLGGLSTGIWLTHTFFCYYFGVTAEFIASLRYSVPALVVLMAITCLSTLLIDWFWGRVGAFVRFARHALGAART